MDVFNLLAKIGLDTSEYESKLSKLGSGAKAAMKVVGGAVAAGTAVAAKFGKDALQAGMDFDSSMSQVAATMGDKAKEYVKIDGQIVRSIDALREYAQEMGATTAFSATEAADALNYMALAGYDAETSMKMLPNVLNLAAAGGIELASASDMITDAQTALNLSLPETTAMVDQMAKASSKSNTSVAQLGEAMLTIGANARNVKGGTAELATMLGVLADNGIKGGEAGTHLRNIMLALNPTTEAAAAAWDELGVKTYDANGNMRALPDIMTDIGAAMADMSEQEKSVKLSAMFNKTDLASINALIGTQAERYAELTDMITDSGGAAQAMADTQLDNLAGDITLFKSALEGAKIAVSDKLTPALRKFVEFGSDGLSQLTTAFQEDGLTGAMDVLGNLLSDGLGMIIEFLPTMVEAGMKLIGSLVDGILDNLDVIIDAAFRIIESLGNSLFAEGNIEKIISSAFDLVLRLGDGILEALPKLIPAIKGIIDRIVVSLTDQDSVNQLIDTALDILMFLADAFVESLPYLVEAAFKLIGALVNYILDPDNLVKLVTAAVKLVASLAAGLWNARLAMIKSVMDLIHKVVETFSEFDWKSVGKNIVDGILNGLKNAWTSLKKWFSNALKSLVGDTEDQLEINSPSKVFARIGGYMAEGLGDGWNDEFADVKKDITGGLNFSAVPATAKVDVTGATGGMFSEDSKALTEAFRNALDSYEIKWDDRNLGRLVRQYA